MAKRFVQISLATKFRVLFGASVLGIIAAALVVPWYFMELLAERNVQRLAAELTRLRLNEALLARGRGQDPSDESASRLVALYQANPEAEGLAGPLFISMLPDGDETKLDSAAKRARAIFEQSSRQTLAVFPVQDDQGRRVYRCFRAVRADARWRDAAPAETAAADVQAGQLVGLIDVTIPASAAAGSLMWWTRGAFVVGAALAALLAFFLFVLITQRLILRPVRRLKDIADRVAVGDLTARCDIRTGDELQRLGESFDEMVEAVAEQHARLRSANRALDLKLNELGEVNVALYEANQVKSEFLTNISHELRTPLNSIIGFADLLAELDDDRVRRYGRNIGEAARSLLSMINDLLDLAKIEAGKSEVRVDKVSVAGLCRSLVTLMKPQADNRRLTLKLALTEGIPLVETDGGKVQQILYNLLSNAVKFTPPGGEVSVSATYETPDEGREGFGDRKSVV